MSNLLPHRYIDREYSPGIDCSDSEDMTEQHHAESCDIHSIMRQADKTGIVTHLNQYEGSYGNFIDAPDFTTAMQQIAAAKSLFESVPSAIRSEFDNDPAKFLDFVQNPENKQAMDDYGLDTSHFPVEPEKIEPAAPVSKTKESPPDGDS